MKRLIPALKSRILVLLFVSAVCVIGLLASGLFIPSGSAGSDKSVAVKSVAVRAAGRGNPWVNLQDSRDVETVYTGSAGAKQALQTGEARPLSLTSGDFDFDGSQDLVAGYATPSGGVLTLLHGNVEAFAPQSPKVLRQISNGRFPDPFLKEAIALELPEAPDFLGAGDFDRDGSIDVIAAARGSNSLYLLRGDGAGSLLPAQRMTLPGNVTAMVTGDIGQPDGAADLAVGIASDQGPKLLVYQTEATASLFSCQPAVYPLQAEATSLALGRLDDDRLIDLAVLAGSEVLVLHGQDRFSAAQGTPQTPLERISLPCAVKAIALGDFITDRSFRTEIAALAQDGTLLIISRGDLDTRPLAASDVLQLRRRHAEERQSGKLAATAAIRKPVRPLAWQVAETLSTTVHTFDSDSSQPVLMRARLAGRPADDLLVGDPASPRLQILFRKAGDQTAPPSRASVTLDAESEFVATLPMRLNVDGRPGLVVLSKGRTAPSLVMVQSAEIITVNTAADTVAVDASTSALDAGGNISLRSAIQRSNANPGADTIMFSTSLNGTPITLTLAGNDNAAAVGDLDINDSVTIIGNGSANTIVQAGTNNTNGIDKVFGIDQNGVGGIAASISGITIRFGKNSVVPVGDFTETAGGLDFFDFGTNTMDLTGCVISDNSDVHSYGGGINIDAAAGGGPVTITGCTISNNRTLSSDPGEVSTGGGLNLFGDTQNVTLTNCTISGNSTTGQWEGGGVFIRQTNGGSIQLHNCGVSGNSAGSRGGGISIDGLGVQAVTIDQASIIAGNTSGTNASGVAEGGGIYNANAATASTTLNKVTITNNSLSAVGTQAGGGGLANGPGDMTVSFSRIVGNTAASGPGLHKDNQAGTVTAQNNWWSCNTNPSTGPCNVIVVVAPGVVTFTPWLTLTHTASPSSICANGTSTLTASFLKDSNNNSVSAANLDVLIGLPITFSNAVLGTISNAQATIQASGTATATFTSNGTSGSGSADATVDTVTVTAPITIQSAPSATITPNPTSVCANSTGNQASGPAAATTYSWSIANGTITSAANIQTITYTAGASGNVTLSLTVTNAFGCSGSSSALVPIQPVPSATITPNPTSVCPNSTGNQASAPAGASSYAWTIANGTITSAANIQTITYTAGASGNVTLSVTVTNAFGCSASNSVNVPIGGSVMTALSPALVWVGLKNSDDVGTKFDLLAEVFQNNTRVGFKELDDVPGGSSGFNNAVLSSINLVLSGQPGFCAGDTLSFQLSVRVAASSSHHSGTARLWFNSSTANSHFDATIGSSKNYFLLSGFALGNAPGSGPNNTIDVFVDRNVGGNPFKPFGTSRWSTIP